jgi:membrane protease YdiL (CAAX protease family)
MKNSLRFSRNSRNPTIPESILIWFAVLFFWNFSFSYLLPDSDNLEFLKYGATGATIYYIAKYIKSPNDIFGCIPSRAHAIEIFLVLAATVFIGISSWALLVYLDSIVNGPLAYQRWNLVSHNNFSQIHWSGSWLIANFFTTAVLVPISEEIIFRGFILNRLRERHGLVFSIVTSAGIFALFHFNKSFLGPFIHGIIFAILAVRTSSLYAPMLVHGLYNAIILALTVVFGFSMVGDEKKISLLSYWVPEIICGVIGFSIFAIYLLCRSFRPHRIVQLQVRA